MKAIALLAASVFAVGSRADDAAAETDQSLPSYTPPRHRSPPLPLEHHRRRHHSRHCADLRDSCGDRVHECDTHRRWMHPHCPVTCQVCHTRVQSVPRRSAFGPATLTLSDNDDDDSDDGGNNGRIYDAVGASIGVPQIVAGTEEQRAAIARVVTESTAYYQTIVMKQERYVTVREACKNTNSMCAIYEAMEERCHDDDDGGNDDEGNGSNVVMARDCAVTCRRCEALSPAAQCPYDPNTMRNAWYPGDVDAMFERIVRDSKDRTTPYDIQILSRPQSSSADSNAVDGPWVVTLDHFLSDEECDRLIVLGDSANDGAGYERSVGMRLDRAGVLEEVVSDQRTSQTAWCNAVDCRSDPVAKAVRHRMANLTRIPTTHFEPLQLLRYEPGEFYKTHHDYVPTEKNEYQGPRILTIFLYLSDVDEGGGTNFPALALTVQPQKGRALLWPSVLDAKPNDLDLRVLHQALPVTHGVKYGANVWLHQRDTEPAACLAAQGLDKTNDE